MRNYVVLILTLVGMLITDFLAAVGGGVVIDPALAEVIRLVAYALAGWLGWRLLRTAPPGQAGDEEDGAA